MKAVHWISLAATLYLVVVGVNEFLPIGTVSALDGLPDAGALVPNTSSTATGGNYYAGAIDLAVAATLYFFVLHKKLAL